MIPPGRLMEERSWSLPKIRKTHHPADTFPFEMAPALRYTHTMHTALNLTLIALGDPCMIARSL